MRRMEELLNKEVSFVELDNVMVKTDFTPFWTIELWKISNSMGMSFIPGLKVVNVKLRSVLKLPLTAEKMKAQKLST